MMAAHLRGLLKPVGRADNDRLRETLVLEAMDMQDQAKRLQRTNAMLVALTASGSYDSQTRKEMRRQFVESLEKAHTLESLDLLTFMGDSSELSDEQVHAAIAAAGIIKSNDGN